MSIHILDWVINNLHRLLHMNMVTAINLNNIYICLRHEKSLSISFAHADECVLLHILQRLSLPVSLCWEIARWSIAWCFSSSFCLHCDYTDRDVRRQSCLLPKKFPHDLQPIPFKIQFYLFRYRGISKYNHWGITVT